MSEQAPQWGGWPHQLRDQLPCPGAEPGRRPSPKPVSARQAADERQQQARTFGTLLSGRSARRTFGRRPIADELFRIGTDPYEGTTRIGRHLLSIGCAAGLLAELMVETRPDLIPDRPPRPLLSTYTSRGVPVLAPDLDLLRHAPPRDALAYQVADEIVKDAADNRRPVTEYVEYLAGGAYARVADRLVRDRYMVESVRRRWPSGRRRRVWTAAEPTGSLNAMNRLPRELRDGRPLAEADRLLLGLIDAVNLTGPVRREFGQRFSVPDRLHLAPRLQALVTAAKTVVGAQAARR